MQNRCDCVLTCVSRMCDRVFACAEALCVHVSVRAYVGVRVGAYVRVFARTAAMCVNASATGSCVCERKRRAYVHVREYDFSHVFPCKTHQNIRIQSQQIFGSSG